MNNSIAARMDFEKAVQLFATAWGISISEAIQRFRPTQSRLRLEQLASTTTTSIRFPVLVNDGTPFNTEVRLNLQDSMVPTHVRFCIGNPTGSTDAAYKIFTYINPFFLNTAMQAYYNGTMSVMLNNDQYINNWPLDWHQNANQTQQTLVAGAGSPVDQYNGAVDGKVSQQPFVIFMGSKNIDIRINLPVAPTAVTANSRIILEFDGILFQNSTVVQ